MIERNSDDDDYIDDDHLLIEAARHAVRTGVSRSRFMSLSKKAWFAADAEERGRQWERRRQQRERQSSKP